MRFMSPNGKSNYLRNSTTTQILNRPMSQATRVFVLPHKLSSEEEKSIKERVERLGAKLSPAAFANTFLTKSKAPKPNAASIKKAVKLDVDNGIAGKPITDDEIRSLTVVTLGWLDECERKQITVSCSPYQIVFPQDLSTGTSTALQAFSQSQPTSSIQPVASTSSASQSRETQVVDLDTTDEEDGGTAIPLGTSNKRKMSRSSSATSSTKRARQVESERRREGSTPPLPRYVRLKSHELNDVPDGKPFEIDSDDYVVQDLSNEPELDENAEVSILDHSPVPPFNKDKKQHLYACVRPSPLKCINQDLVDELNVILEQRLMTKGPSDPYSVHAYSRAVSVLKAYPEDLSKKRPDPGKWAQSNLNGIGGKVAKAISQFYQTGSIQEAQTILNDPAFRITKSLMDLYGVGPVKATEYYSKGCRTAEDVVKCGNKLGTNLDPRECLKILPDLKRKICRKEVELVAEEIAEAMKEFMPECEYVIGGGYRRGKPLSSDIDIIFSKKEGAADLEPGESNQLMHKVIDQLRLKGRMTHSVNIAGADKTYPDGNKHEISSAQFVYLPECHPSSSRPIHRRIDLIVTPRKVYGAVLMGWTGSRQFEKDIRRLATKHNFKFHNTGIVKNSNGSVVPTPTERDVFDLLEIPYMPPHMRNCE